jgi:hypothetical protein
VLRRKGTTASVAPRTGRRRREGDVSTVDLARLQFASTSIYHFLRQHLTRGRARRRGPG